MSTEGRDGAGRDGACSEGAGRDGAGRDGAGRDGAGRDGAGRREGMSCESAISAIQNALAPMVEPENPEVRLMDVPAFLAKYPGVDPADLTLDQIVRVNAGKPLTVFHVEDAPAPPVSTVILPPPPSPSPSPSPSSPKRKREKK